MLPAWLTVYFTLALALFMDMGAGRVMRKLAGVLAWAGRGVTVVIPSEEALSNARTRLGPAPLRLLFEQTAGLLAGAGAPGGVLPGRAPGGVGGGPLGVEETRGDRGRGGGAPSPGDRGGGDARGGPRAACAGVDGGRHHT